MWERTRDWKPRHLWDRKQTTGRNYERVKKQYKIKESQSKRENKLNCYKKTRVVN
jgi:hypothetical protein